ncbi:MAG: hypothetical protein SVQ76_00320 [Candidatus Nanohaloarchaea archaeon]|nr:hypothetical protein [Candidatus Nanohaloarchaea archaeon]
MKKVLLDANFLVLPFQFNVSVFDELERVLEESYQVYTLNRTYNEALELEDGRYREQVERLVDETPVKIVSRESDLEVDDLLVELAGEFVVCTNDSEVRGELEEKGLPHIYMRQESYLEGENLRSSLPF